MTTDIYTLKEIEHRSDEHVVPRSLGGRLASDRLLDKDTNDRFGHGIDADLAEALRAVRILANAQSTDGHAPRALVSVRGDDGATYRVESGGVAKVEPRVLMKELETGELALDVRVSGDHDLRGMLKKKARRAGMDASALVEKAMAMAKSSVEPLPRMTFWLSLWQDGPYRATAKIACNMLAHTAPDLFLGREFDEVRRYVLQGERCAIHPVHAVELDLGGAHLGQLDHFVKIEQTPSGEVVALVVYFRFLAFVVRLGSLEQFRGFSTSYRVDQLGKAHCIDGEQDCCVPIPSFSHAIELTHAEYVDLTRGQRKRLVHELERIQREHWLGTIIDPIFERFFKEVGDGDPTEAQKFALVGAIAMGVVKEMAPRIAQASRQRRETEHAAAFESVERTSGLREDADG